MSPPKELSLRQLRNHTDEVLRAVDAGESVILIRNGLPVAEIRPLRRSHFVPKAIVLSAFRNAPAIDPARLREDLDALADPAPPRRGSRY